MSRALLVVAVLLVASGASLLASAQRTALNKPSAAQCSIEPSKHIDCGFVGIEQSQCVARGCCFQHPVAGGYPECYYPGEGVEIKTVHVVAACHLDVGFADTAEGIVNEYFDTYFPRAHRIGKALEARGGPEQLKFMTQSYLVSLYLSCPSGMGLHCPNASAVADFEEAVKKDWITWHAFPFNAELEKMDPALIEGAIEMTHALDARFGKAPKATLSQRDVPGIARSIIPILNKYGIHTVSVGVNGASMPPNVPAAFRWVDPVSNESVLAMWHPGGYGGVERSDAVMVPGVEDALVFAWRGDNAGPPESVDEVLATWAHVKAEFPFAKVIASTFDDFAQRLATVAPDVIPTFDGEIGDSWIYGVPSDAYKVARERVVMRARTDCLNSGACSKSDPVFLNFTRLLTKAGEHTDGLDVKHFLADTTNWSNQKFQAARHASNYVMMVKEWLNQRAWDFEFAVQALNGNALAKTIQAEFLKLTPSIPTTTGYNVVTDFNTPIDCGRFKIRFDAHTGAIVSLIDSHSQLDWAATDHMLALPIYQSFNQSDYDVFFKEYITQPLPSWAPADFGKPGVDTAAPQSQLFYPQLQTLYVKADGGSTSFLVRSSFASNAYVQYGAPQSVWTQVDVSKTGIAITLQLFNKTATRLPETMLFNFNPSGFTKAYADKLGEWVEAGDFIAGGSPHLHGVWSGLRFERSTSASLQVQTLDAGIALWGKPTGFPSPCNVGPDMSYGGSLVLFDNLWGTNYVMWQPFIESEGNYKFRFHLVLPN